MYSVVIDDVVYQGEGTTSKIAKAIAAAKALEGIRVSVVFLYLLIGLSALLFYTMYIHLTNCI